MHFTSYTFAILFVVVVAAHLSPLPWRAKKLNLVAASYLFYAGWNVYFLGLLLVSTLIGWLAARAIAASTQQARRRLALIAAIFLSAAMFAFFKYASLFLGTSNENGALASIVLPVGLSFFTLHTISYAVDVYRRTAEPAQSFADYALYIAFFPKLLAGPITRAADFLPSLERETRPSRQDLGFGLFLILLGLWQKLVIADTLFAHPTMGGFKYGSYSVLLSWVAAVGFAGQLFFDLAGYSCCAIGTARCLGFRLPSNFRSPFTAVGFVDFWQRWFVTLSQWARDYIYRPIAGDSKGRAVVAVLVTCLVAGLWHGAQWTFLLWGALHAAYLLVEAVVRASPLPKLIRPRFVRVGLAWACTFVAVLVAMLVFHASSPGEAWVLIKGMFGGAKEFASPFNEPLTEYTFLCYGAGAVFVINLAISWWLRDLDFEEQLNRMPQVVVIAIIAFLLVTLVIGTERRYYAYDSVQFYYFRF